jgi:hydrophobe/amphiphile efflux-3 (HAE3) family protein
MKRSKKAIFNTIKKMVPAIMIAMIATVLGLLSLYRSKVPMINDFGSMLTIGLIAAFIIAVFVFLPFLYIRDAHFPKKEIKKQKKTKDNKVIYHMVDFIIKIKYVILGIAVLLAVVGIYVDQSADAETQIENFMPQDSQALTDIQSLREIIGSTEQIAIVLEDVSILDVETLDKISLIETQLETSFDTEIIEMSSILNLFNQMGITDKAYMNQTSIENIPLDQRKLFINDTYTKTVINVSIDTLDEEEFSVFIAKVNEIVELQNITFTITGQSIIDSEMMIALTNGRYEITIIGLILIFLSLLLIYKSFYRAILPLIPIVLIVGWSGGIMAIFNVSYTPLTATLGALIMGIGTEFTILIVERYEEEKTRIKDNNEAIKVALSKMSNPILVSALTTMGGFSALIFSDFIILSNFGIMTLVNLSLALLSTIFVLPAFLAIKKREEKTIQPIASS